MQLPGDRARAATTLAAVLAIALLVTDCAPLRRLADEYRFSEDPGLPGLPTADHAATRAYLRNLYFVTTPKVSVIECHGGVTTTLHIFPEFRSHHLDHASAKVRGRIVARVENAGPRRCDDLMLDPGAVAYWWMGPDRNFPVTTNFYRIPDDQARPIERVAHTGETKRWPETQSPAVDATISATSRHGRGGDDGDAESLGFTHNITWIACLNGCCESATLVEQ